MNMEKLWNLSALAWNYLFMSRFDKVWTMTHICRAVTPSPHHPETLSHLSGFFTFKCHILHLFAQNKTNNVAQLLRASQFCADPDLMDTYNHFEFIDYFLTLEIKSVFIFTPISQTDCSSDPQRWTPDLQLLIASPPDLSWKVAGFYVFTTIIDDAFCWSCFN